MPSPISPGGYLKVEEVDGSPTKDIKRLIVTNGWLVDAGAGAFRLAPTFAGLEDVGLSDYDGLANYVLQVNGAETGPEAVATFGLETDTPELLDITEDGGGNRLVLDVYPPAPAIMNFNHAVTSNDAVTVAYQVWPLSNQRWHWWDLTRAKQASLTVRVITAFATNTRLRVEYTLDMNGASGWTPLDNSAGPSVQMYGASTTQLSGWVNITAAAQAEVLLRLAIGGAINASGQTIGTIELMVR